MSQGRVRHAFRYLHGLFGRSAPVAHPDRELLEAFAVRRDETAFAALVERHGPLVWGMCRRILAHEQDAEDAFQATFLVLARKAGTVSWREDIGNWLYAVALRVARRARSRNERQRHREHISAVVEEAVAEPDPARAELAAIIDEEVGRLPDKYRRPVVLCCLEGLTYLEAARRLGWPEGTVSARLSRAREMLRRRLTRRGLALAVLPAMLAEAAAAVPTLVQRSTIQSALMSAAGTLHGPAAELAEGVMRAMFQTKATIGAATVLVLALTGVGMVALAGGFGENPPRPKEPLPMPPARARDEQPALPKEWAGRWSATPFAGAKWIEVRHAREASPLHQVYEIKDVQTVAGILKAARVVGVQNDIAVGSIATARIIAHFPEGKPFEGVLDRSFNLSCDGGILILGRCFYTALSKAASRGLKQPVDLSQPLPPPNNDDVKPGPEASPKSLETGFSEISITFLVGRRLHRTLIGDEKTLAALHKAFAVRALMPAPKGLAETRKMTITTKDRACFNFHIQNGQSIFDFNVGHFLLTPAFFNELNKEVKRRTGFDIDVTAKDNPLPARIEERSAEFRKLLGTVKSIRFVEKLDGAETALVVDDPKQVAELIGRISPGEVLLQKLNLKPTDRRVELTLKDGKTVTMTCLNTGQDSRGAESAAAVPSLSELVDVPGFGQVWVSNQWLTRLRDQVYMKQLKARGERNLETARLVCRDLPAFYKHVISVDVLEEHTRGLLPPKEARKVIAALSAGKFEALDWPADRWRKELGGSGHDSLGVELSPGLGFSLRLVTKGDKEIYFPGVGKLTFAESPVPVIRKAIDEAAAEEKDKDRPE